MRSPDWSDASDAVASRRPERDREQERGSHLGRTLEVAVSVDRALRRASTRVGVHPIDPRMLAVSAGGSRASYPEAAGDPRPT